MLDLYGVCKLYKITQNHFLFQKLLHIAFEIKRLWKLYIQINSKTSVDLTLQYKKEVDIMLDIIRSYIQSKTSSNEIENTASPPAIVQESR